MSKSDRALRLVFTDLDGSLLDHHSYSYQDALPQLRKLQEQDIPVVAASSKTRAEIQALRSELGNVAPYIAENGAAVYIPEGYFADLPEGCRVKDDEWVCEFSQPRQHWLDLLDKLESEFHGEFDSFARAGDTGVARMTGLPPEQAAMANQRDSSEPVQWLGSPERKEAFVSALKAAGAEVLQGGRFMAVGGDCDKGRALRWLRGAFLQARGAPACRDLAVGDSDNDCAMLEAAETALLIRSPVHGFPALSRSSGVLYSKEFGPAGWAEGVARWLREIADTF